MDTLSSRGQAGGKGASTRQRAREGLSARDAAHPPFRGEGGGAFSRGRAPRLPPRRHRPGGRGRRRLPGARGRRRDRVHASRARAHNREGDASQRGHGGALRQGRGLQPRLRRLDASLRHRARQPRRQCGRGRRTPGHRRRRLRLQDAEGTPRRGRVLRRRRHEHRHVPRGAQPCRAVEGAGRLRLREQPLRRVDAVQAAAADRGPDEARQGVRNGFDEGRRPGRRGRLQDDAESPQARSRRGRPDLPSRRDLPPDGPLRRRPPGLSAEGGDPGGAADTGSDHQAPRAARALRGGVERNGRGGDEDRRGVRRVREEGHRPQARRRSEKRLRLMPEISYREAVRDAMSEAMRRDEDVFIMGEDIAEMGGSMGVTQGMLDEFGPERVRNTPISEMAIVGSGVGAAMAGMRPIVEVMYQDFLTLAMEQLVSQAAKHRYMSGGQVKVPLTVRTQGGAGWSPGAQHAQQLESWFVHVPGLKVVFASTPEDVRGLLWASIYEDNPIVFFEHRTLYGIKGEVPDEIQPIEIGKARIHREGEDVTVVATGRLVHESLNAAEQAGEEGISVEVFDPRTLQPLDEDALIASVKKTNRAVVAHEAVTRMGWGAEVAAIVQEKAFDYLDAPIARVGARFAPIPFSPVMEEWVVPHAKDVLAAIKKTVGKE